MERKEILRVFTQNGCHGNQLRPLEVLFDSTDPNNPCSFTYLVGFCFCFVLFNKRTFWQLVLVFSALYRLYLKITVFCTKSSEQIVYCRVTDVKMLRFFYFIEYRHYWSLITPNFRNLSLILSKVEMLAQSQLVQRGTFKKNALKVFHMMEKTCTAAWLSCHQHRGLRHFDSGMRRNQNFRSTFWKFLCISQAPFDRSLWSRHYWKDLLLPQKLSTDDANFGQKCWRQKWKKGQGSSWPSMAAWETMG